jgi:TRAP-type C4-dicarboxylate transport system substrate-binding protein
MMRNAKNMIVGALVLGLGALLTTPVQAENFTWKLANPWPAKHPATKAIVALLDDLRERSGGSLDIQMVHLDAIGFKQGDLLRVLKQGVREASLFVPYYVSRDDSMLANVLPTGGLTDAEQNLVIADIQREYAKRLLEKNWNAVMAAPFFNRGGRELIVVSREPINTLDGLKGKKLRHFDKLGLKAVQQLGINGQILPQGELYLALKTGVVDAAVHGMTNAKAQSIYEVTCCFSEFTPFPGQGAPYGLIVRKEHWDKLSEAQKQAVAAAGKKSWDEGVALWRDATLTNEARSFMVGKGARDLGPFSQAERKKLQQVVFEVWKQECEKLGPEAVELYNQIVAKLGGA